MIRIGISASFFPPDNSRVIFKGKTLLYSVQNIGDWILSAGALAYQIPTCSKKSTVKVSDFVNDLDGLVLQGGSDVAPESYGESPLQPEWQGDALRDFYEIELIKEFLRQDKPILGVCRGLQILNVALGGTLYQDIPSQISALVKHRDGNVYDQNFHPVEIVEGSEFSRIYPHKKKSLVNSIHHQAVKVLGQGLKVEAISTADQIVEAVSLPGKRFVVAVQWHPEFQFAAESEELLSTEPLLNEYLKACGERKEKA